MNREMSYLLCCADHLVSALRQLITPVLIENSQSFNFLVVFD